MTSRILRTLAVLLFWPIATITCVLALACTISQQAALQIYGIWSDK